MLNCNKCGEEWGAPATLRIHESNCTVKKPVSKVKAAVKKAVKKVAKKK